MKQNQETDITTDKKEKGFHINIHIIILGAIVLIAGFSAYRLYTVSYTHLTLPTKA